jgi:hypothetical protein
MSRLAPPTLPAVVHVLHRADAYTAHIADAEHLHGRHHPPMATFAVRRIASIRWCGTCWPGRRCVTCGAPSGDAGECAWCLPDGIRAETTHDRAEEWTS